MILNELPLLEEELSEFPITKRYIQSLSANQTSFKFNPQWTNAISNLNRFRAVCQKIGKLTFYDVVLYPNSGTSISWATNIPVMIVPVDPQNDVTDKYGTSGMFQGKHELKYGDPSGSVMTYQPGYILPQASGVKSRIRYGTSTISPGTNNVVYLSGFYWME